MKTSQHKNIDLFFNLTQEIWMTYPNILNITAHQFPDSNWCWQICEGYSNENNYLAETLSSHKDLWGGWGGGDILTWNASTYTTADITVNTNSHSSKMVVCVGPCSELEMYGI
jgi:hypothetical protein